MPLIACIRQGLQMACRKRIRLKTKCLTRISTGRLTFLCKAEVRGSIPLGSIIRFRRVPWAFQMEGVSIEILWDLVEIAVTARPADRFVVHGFFIDQVLIGRSGAGDRGGDLGGGRFMGCRLGGGAALASWLAGASRAGLRARSLRAGSGAAGFGLCLTPGRGVIGGRLRRRRGQ